MAYKLDFLMSKTEKELTDMRDAGLISHEALVYVMEQKIAYDAYNKGFKGALWHPMGGEKEMNNIYNKVMEISK